MLFIITKKLEESKCLLIFIDIKEINKARKIESKQMSNQEMPERQSNYAEGEDLEIRTGLSKTMVGGNKFNILDTVDNSK